MKRDSTQVCGVRGRKENNNRKGEVGKEEEGRTQKYGKEQLTLKIFEKNIETSTREVS